MSNTAPVLKEHWSDASHATNAAASSGCPARPAHHAASVLENCRSLPARYYNAPQREPAADERVLETSGEWFHPGVRIILVLLLAARRHPSPTLKTSVAGASHASCKSCKSPPGLWLPAHAC